MMDEKIYVERSEWLNSNPEENIRIKYAYMTDGEINVVTGNQEFYNWLEERIKLALSLVQGKSNESLREYVNSIKERR